MKRFDLQLFAAPANLTDNTAIAIKAREIDFVSSFGRSLKALLDVMSISRMIEKPNGTVLKTKSVTGTLASGIVAEGEEIPLTKYEVKETPLETITLEKYRKAVSIEAIAEKGYEAAVEKTDNEFKAGLQANITGKFYTGLKAGTLTGTKATFQAAIAGAVGLVTEKFEKIEKECTGVAVWVNTLDLFDYLGGAEITMQTAFGMKYLKEFLGADILFVSSKIERNSVIATPLNNLVAYYVNPANPEFKKAGLDFTVDSETGFIGFHAQGTYERAITDMYALMGVRIFAEYLDGIAKVTVQGA